MSKLIKLNLYHNFVRENCAMKKYILLMVAVIAVAGCNSDDYNYRNPNLPDYNFSIDIDMNLPLYYELEFTGNPVYIGQAGIGINGIIVTNTGSGFSAFEASCPNQPLSDCSMLGINGINAICPCDDVEFNLFTGLPSTEVKYSLKPYRVQQTGPKTLRVYN
jgi:nitrite reductase/ring-hydroxylating ferredoxin subunit